MEVSRESTVIVKLSESEAQSLCNICLFIINNQHTSKLFSTVGIVVLKSLAEKLADPRILD